MDWKIKSSGDYVLTVHLQGGKGSEWHFLLVSDVHIDSAHCRRDIFFKHMRRAQKMGAAFLFNGDFFDAMQGRFDPRRSMDELRPEYRRDDYYDFVVRDAARLLEPYARDILLMGRGNHETAVRRRNGIDMVEWLVYVLRNEYKSPVFPGGYTGWVRFVVKRPDGRHIQTVTLRYAHGAGGGDARVTRGVIQTNRQAVFLPDADIVWNGHNHETYVMPIARERLSVRGVPYQSLTWFIRTSGYKQEYLGKNMGYAVEKGRGPGPMGCVLLTIGIDNTTESRRRWEVYTRAEIWAE